MGGEAYRAGAGTAGRLGGRAAGGARAAAARGAAADSDAGRAAREVALSGHDLVVVGAQREAGRLPGVEVGRHVDGATGALVDADRPELVEGAGALDGRLVGALGLVDVVDGAVRSDGAELGGTGRGIVLLDGLAVVGLGCRVGELYVPCQSFPQRSTR